MVKVVGDSFFPYDYTPQQEIFISSEILAQISQNNCHIFRMKMYKLRPLY